MKNVERISDDTFRLTVCAGYEGGKQKRFRRTVKVPAGKTEKAQTRFLESELAKFKAEVERGEGIEKQITLARFAEMWMDDHVKGGGASPVTVSGYQAMLDLHILPALGGLRLDKITPHTITRFYNELSQKPSKRGGTISQRYVRDVHIVLRAMLNVAVKWGYLAHSPLVNVAAPRSDTKRPKVYDEAECARLLEMLEGAPITYRTAITLTLFTGMRKGEVAGLDWTQVNFEKAKVYVAQEAVYVAGEGVVLKSPKTDAGTRAITIPQEAVDALRALRRHQAALKLASRNMWTDTGAVFVNSDTGARLHPDTIPGWFRDFLKRNGMEHIRFHALRHTGASLSIALGESDTAVALRLGHTSANTTRSIYAQAFKEREASTAERMAEAIRGANKPKIQRVNPEINPE